MIIAKSSQFLLSKNQVVREQKFKDLLSSTSQISPERIVLEVNLGSGPLMVTFFFCFITLIYTIFTRSDKIRFKTKKSGYLR